MIAGRRRRGDYFERSLVPHRETKPSVRQSDGKPPRDPLTAKDVARTTGVVVVTVLFVGGAVAMNYLHSYYPLPIWQLVVGGIVIAVVGIVLTAAMAIGAACWYARRHPLQSQEPAPAADTAEAAEPAKTPDTDPPTATE